MPDTAHRPSRPRAALIYDFDGTLARGNLQERSFIPDIAGMKHADFWMEVKRLAKAEDADEILVYMHLMLDRARAAGRPVTRKQLQETGADPDSSTAWITGSNAWMRTPTISASSSIITSSHPASTK
jgi:hypothetical protein